MKRFRLNNRGLGLIELIISISILLIVGGSIVSFLTAASNSYRSVSADSDIQREAQVSVNQLTDLMINTSKAMVNEGGKLVIYNEDHRYVFSYDTADKKIYYEKQLLKGDKTGFLPPEDKVLIADRVESFIFQVPSEVDKEQFARIKIGFKNIEGKTFEKSGTINIRNKLIFSSDFNKIYEVEKQPSVVSEVEIFASTSTEEVVVFANDLRNVTFNAKVIGEGGVIPSQDVLWKVQNNTDSQTKVIGSTSPRLKLGSSESSKEIMIYALSKQNPTIRSKNNIVVKIKKITGIKLKIGASGDSHFPALVNPGEKYDIRAEILGDFLSTSDKKVRWTFSGATKDGDLADGITLSINSVNSGVRRVRVKAVSEIKSSVFAEAGSNIAGKKVDEVIIDGVSEVLFGGQNYTFYAKVKGKNLLPEDKKVTWSYDASVFNEVSRNDKKIVLSPVVNYVGRYIVTATSQADTSVKGKVEGEIRKNDSNFSLRVDNYGLTKVLRKEKVILSTTYNSGMSGRVEVRWKVSGDGLTESDYKFSGTTGKNVFFELLESCDFSKSGNIDFIAELYQDDIKVAGQSIQLPFDRVEMKFYNKDSSDASEVNSYRNPFKNKVSESKNGMYKLTGLNPYNFNIYFNHPKVESFSISSSRQYRIKLKGEVSQNIESVDIFHKNSKNQIGEKLGTFYFKVMRR